jgi:hypothetical protein
MKTGIRYLLASLPKSNSLERTATLDQQTADALIGDTVVGQGSSTPPKGAGAGSMTNSSGTSDFGGPATAQSVPIPRERDISQLFNHRHIGLCGHIALRQIADQLTNLKNSR